MATFEELNLKLRDLYGQKTQYELQIKQMKAQLQNDQREMQTIQKEYTEKQQYIQNHPIDVQAEADLAGWARQVAETDSRGKQALRLIESRIQQDASQEGMKAFLQSENVIKFKKIARGVRQLQARIQAFQNSKEQLTIEKEMKENLKEDIQRELQEIRTSAKESEDKLTQYSQDLYKKRRVYLDEMETNSKSHAEDLKNSESALNAAQDEYNSIKMVVDKLNYQLSSLEKGLPDVYAKIPEDQKALYDTLVTASNNLKDRAEKLSNLLRAKFYLREVHDQNTILNAQLRAMLGDPKTIDSKDTSEPELDKKSEQKISFNNYTQSYNDIHKIQESILGKMNQIQINEDLFKENEKEKNELKAIGENLQKQLNETKAALEEQTAELKNIRGQIADEHRKQNQNMVLEYRVNENLILDFEKQQDLQRKQIERETEAIKQLSIYKQILEGERAQLVQNKSSPSAAKECSQKFKTTTDQLLNLLQSMVSTSDASLQDFESQIKDRREKLSKDIESLKWNVNRQEMLKISRKVQKEETDNPQHGSVELQDYNKEQIKYTTENGKLYIDIIEKEDLVAILFNPYISDALFSQALFAWHNSYFSDLANMEKALKEFCEILEKLLIGYENRKLQFGLNERPSPLTVATVVTKIFQNWFDQFPTDFGNYNDAEGNKVPHATWKELIEKAKAVLLKAEAICRSEDSDENQHTASECDALRKRINEKPILKMLKIPEIIGSAEESTLPFITNPDISPSVIANHFMYYELTLYNSIQRYEYLRCAWSKPKRDEFSPNLSKLTKHFNETAVFVAYSIVQPMPNVAKKNEKQTRVNILQKWIEVMEESQKINNYNLIFEIDGALTNPAIIRLKPLWNSLPADLQQRYKKLSSLTAPFRKFATYKEALKNAAVEKTLPYLGPWLTEMTFVEDGNPGKKPLPNGQEGINFTKMRSYYLPTLFLMNKWGTECQFTLNSNLLKEIENITKQIENVDNSKLFTYSNECVKAN